MKKGTSSTGTNTSTLSGSKTASRGKKSLFQRAINPRDAAAFTTEELHVVVYWMRQALGIVLGLIWGLIPLTGALGFILSLACNMVVTVVYVRYFASKVNDEREFTTELLFEGLPASFGMFAVLWIISYTLAYHYK